MVSSRRLKFLTSQFPCGGVILWYDILQDMKLQGSKVNIKVAKSPAKLCLLLFYKQHWSPFSL